jgi:Uma2 family endonuclease
MLGSRAMSMQPSNVVSYRLAGSQPSWELSDETMPESVLHDAVVEVLKALLAAWAAPRGGMAVVRNLAVRWDEANPRFGVDPDVALLSPAPPDLIEVKSLRTWMPGHLAPVLAIEVVSETDPRKDYSVAPDKYAASGTRELWVFDPLLCGPTSHGGPFRLQVWVRGEGGAFTRAYAGAGPAFSPVLGAYAVPVDEGQRLRIAGDAAATELWLTAEETERAAKEAALARIAELEAELRRR